MKQRQQRASFRSVFPASPDFDTMGIEWFDGPVEDGAPDFDWMSFVDRSTSRVTDTLFHVTTETTGGPSSLGPSEWLTASAPAPHAHTLAWFGVPDAAGRVFAVHGMYDETREYEYDATTGRLLRVMRIGDDVYGDEVLESFSWDANGNPTGRTSVLGGASVTIGPADIEVDEQDRLLRYGDREYYYDASGQVSAIFNGLRSVGLFYDDFGNLRRVATSGAGVYSDEIRYDADAAGRRVARHIVGAPAESRYWLYQDALNPVAQLDAQHRLESVFLYGQRSHSPSVVVTFDVTTGERDRVFRALHDMRGSIIALVDAESGEIVQETEYSAFGEVVAHSGVAEGTYHPFGFAGGLYDPSTGLTRFGARDYDAYVGRWLDRDPILWDGGLWNLYDYVGGDPINWVDPTGLLVVGGFSHEAGMICFFEPASMRWLCIDARSGGDFGSEGIPPGEWEILEREGRDFYRLDAEDESPGDDRHESTGRDLFRLHGPGVTIGCISAESEDEWADLHGILQGTSTRETIDRAIEFSYVGLHGNRVVRRRNEPISSYGTLFVF